MDKTVIESGYKIFQIRMIARMTVGQEVQKQIQEVMGVKMVT